MNWADATGRPGAYSGSKLYVTALSTAVARRWQDVASNAVDPGWVPTRMGGPGAPDDLALGHATQVWLAVQREEAGSGGYWFHQRRRKPHRAMEDGTFQAELLERLEQYSGFALPE